MSSTTNSSFLPHSSGWEKDEGSQPCDCWDTRAACSRTFQQLQARWGSLLYHTTSALLSALCSDCFKILLTTFPILSSKDLLSLAFCQCFPRKLKENLLPRFWNQSLQEQQDYRKHIPFSSSGRWPCSYFLSLYSCKFLLIAMKQIYGAHLECFPTCRKKKNRTFWLLYIMLSLFPVYYKF